jgi:cytochrome c peroxidase
VTRAAALLLAVAVAVAACAGDGAYTWDLPPGLPEPLVPDDNPMSDARVALGRHLFYDTRLSGNQTYACASCHEQARAFTDGRARALGSTGQVHPRGSMSLANVAYLGRFGWGNPLLFELEDQAIVPMFGAEPVELGLKNREAELLERLAAEPVYQQLFADAFPDDADAFTVANVVRALACFERTLLSGTSPFDAWQGGDASAVSPAARRGYALFDSERLECFHCHQGFNLQDVVKYVGKPTVEARFHNTGLYNLGGTGAYPAGGEGLFEITGQVADMGRFRAPTLRNLAVTAPYFHDGSAATLDDVIDHYAAGGRTIPDGANAGVGADNPYKSSLIQGFTITAAERADLLAFFASLTDAAFLADPRFADPW